MLLPGFCYSKGNKTRTPRVIPKLREALLAPNKALDSASKSHSKVIPRDLKLPVLTKVSLRKSLYFDIFFDGLKT